MSDTTAKEDTETCAESTLTKKEAQEKCAEAFSRGRDLISTMNILVDLREKGPTVRKTVLAEWKERWPAEINGLLLDELLDLYEQTDSDRVRKAVSFLRHYLQEGEE